MPDPPLPGRPVRSQGLGLPCGQMPSSSLGRGGGRRARRSWYPHRADDTAFMRALLNQLRGTVLAMREIRCGNPGAQLLQTDDLGYTHATPTLQ